MIRSSLIPFALVLVSGCATSSVAELRIADLLGVVNEKRADIQVDGNPRLVAGASGRAVSFDGTADRLVLAQNPLTGADEFTVELVVRPRDAYPRSAEPRLLHIESAAKPDRRLTVEMRLTDTHQWYVDAFIKSDGDKLTLANSQMLHPVGQWHHVAVTYRDGVFTTFVDGQQELQGKVHYLPIPGDARTSIGARLNQVDWFAGDIATLRVTPQALAPARFKNVPRRTQ